MRDVENDGVMRYRMMFNAERIMVTSPKALAEVLVTKSYDFVKPPQFRYFLGQLLGIGILLAEGDEHKMQRKNLMPAFAFRHVKDLYPVFWRKANESVNAMAREVQAKAAGEKGDTTVLETGGWESRATLDIIGIAGLGRDFGSIQDPNNKLAQTYAAVFVPNRQMQLISVILGEWFASILPVKRNHDLVGARKLIRATCREMIHAKKEKLARKEPGELDILSVALESGGFTDENLVDQMMTFLAAGHETTATAMTWAVYQMCRHPEMQTRLREEVRAHLPLASDTDCRDVTALDIDHLPYLNAFCAESLRFNSPVSLSLRVAATDTTVLGHPVPKGTRVILPVAAVNRAEQLWGPDAANFNPDRWLPKFDGDRSAASGGASSNYAYMTFLHGPRSCIGMSFAKAEFATLLAAWVGRLEFSFRDPEDADEENFKVRSGITTKPEKGMYANVRVVDGW